MVSDFIEEKNGYLVLTDAEYETAKSNDLYAEKYAQQLLEFGENKEGYWTSDMLLLKLEVQLK